MTTQSQPKANEINIIRLYDAPLKAVWDAWTDSKQVEKWWGPRGFTLTTHSKDLKVGGHWHYTMHGPDGADYVNKTKYFEFEPYKKMVYDHGGNDERKPLFRVTVLFSEMNGKTKLDMTMALPNAEEAMKTRGFIKKAGGESTWDRLAEYLEKESSGKEKFVINRSFDASVDTMYEMWTNPQHFMQWLAPTGFTMKFIKSDIRPGGRSFYSMSSANNSVTMYGHIDYVKMEKPHRLVYTQQFADEKGNVARHPMAPTWPETMLTTVEFTAESANRTRVTVTWEAHGKVAVEEMNTFIQQRAGMTQGWTGSFDKLEEYLAKQ